MAERAPPADPPGPQFMAEKLARLDADLHQLLDAAAQHLVLVPSHRKTSHGLTSAREEWRT